MKNGHVLWVLAALAVVVACAGSEELSPLATPQVPTPDAGTPGGCGSAPCPPPDAGTPPPPPPPPPPDPAPDAGTPPPQQFTLPGDGPVVLGDSKKGWQLVRAAPRAFGAAVDAAGNLYVVAGNDGLYVRRAGQASFRHHSLPQYALSVAAGASGVAYVGYNGQPGCDMALYTGGTREVYKSGDADRIVLSGDGLLRYHYDISTGPGVFSEYPEGREKLCTIARILFDPISHSVWFGANHGVAWGDPDSTKVIEHTHPAINCYPREESEDLTICSGTYWALAADKAGDLWLGGTERSARFPFNTLGKDFDAADAFINAKDPVTRRDVNKIDWWPDNDRYSETRPSGRIDDRPMGFAPLDHGGTWTGSLTNGVAYRAPDGALTHYTVPLISKEISAVRLDPSDGSIWFGHTNGGLTRLKDNTWLQYRGFIGRGRVWDLQLDLSGGARRLVVAFQDGTVGFYSGE